MKRTAIKRRSKTPLAKAKQRLWELCREITFKRHGNDCYTCPARNLSGSNRHCGHYTTKSTCSAEMAYSLDNLATQCYRCNISLSGNWPAFEAHIIADGVNVDELKRSNQDTKGMKADILWYERQIALYESLL